MGVSYLVHKEARDFLPKHQENIMEKVLDFFTYNTHVAYMTIIFLVSVATSVFAFVTGDEVLLFIGAFVGFVIAILAGYFFITDRR